MMGYHIDKEGYVSMGSAGPSYTTVTSSSGTAPVAKYYKYSIISIAADRDNLFSLIEKYKLYKETLDELLPELGKLLSHAKIL